jgi:glyoxylase-like metal-dependent hydrolase (beta-lactamase superfamily II)
MGCMPLKTQLPLTSLQAKIDFYANAYIVGGDEQVQASVRCEGRRLSMIFFWAETPDGWGIPGIHGPLAEDELDGYVQSGVYLIRGKGENLLIDSGNWTLPEFNNGMGEFLVEQLDREKNDLKYLFITHFHYDHVGNALMLKKRYGATVVCHPLDRPIIEDPMLVTRRENVTRFGTTPELMLEDFNLRPGESFGLSDPAVVNKYWNR